MSDRYCACGRAISRRDDWQCDKCGAPAVRSYSGGYVISILTMTIADLWSTVVKPVAKVFLVAVALTALCVTVTGCAENWTYDIKSLRHDEKTGRYYAVCKSEYSETFIQVDVTPEVYQLLKIDSTCPAPMGISPTPAGQPPTT